VVSNRVFDLPAAALHPVGTPVAERRLTTPSMAQGFEVREPIDERQRSSTFARCNVLALPVVMPTVTGTRANVAQQAGMTP
jgi:hypothetical protein